MRWCDVPSTAKPGYTPTFRRCKRNWAMRGSRSAFSKAVWMRSVARTPGMWRSCKRYDSNGWNPCRAEQPVAATGAKASFWPARPADLPVQQAMLEDGRKQLDEADPPLCAQAASTFTSLHDGGRIVLRAFEPKEDAAA